MTTFADRLMIAWRDRTAPIPVLRLAKSIDPHVALIRPPQSSIRFVIETQGRAGRHTRARIVVAAAEASGLAAAGDPHGVVRPLTSAGGSPPSPASATKCW
jgi:hypothetical protein